MAIGAIIVTSLSYASQMWGAGYICNAERFNNKASVRHTGRLSLPLVNKDL